MNINYICNVDSNNFDEKINYDKKEIKNIIKTTFSQLLDNILSKVMNNQGISIDNKNEMIGVFSQEFKEKSSELVDIISSQFVQSQKKEERNEFNFNNGNNQIINFQKLFNKNGSPENEVSQTKENPLKRKSGEERENDYPNKIRKMTLSSNDFFSQENQYKYCQPINFVQSLEEILTIPDSNKKKQSIKNWEDNFSNFPTPSKVKTIEKIFENKMDMLAREELLFCFEKTFIEIIDNIQNKKTRRHQLPKYIEKFCKFLLNTPELELIINKWLINNTRIDQAIHKFLILDLKTFQCKIKGFSLIATSALYIYLFYCSYHKLRNLFQYPQQQLPINDEVLQSIIQDLNTSQDKDHLKWLQLIRSKKDSF